MVVAADNQLRDRLGYLRIFPEIWHIETELLYLHYNKVKSQGIRTSITAFTLAFDIARQR